MCHIMILFHDYSVIKDEKSKKSIIFVFFRIIVVFYLVKVYK
jgi:hypothetical protein